MPLRPRLHAWIGPRETVAQLLAPRHRQGGMPMFQVPPMLRNGYAIRWFAAGVLLAFAAINAGSLTARGEDRVPGLTGTDRPDEVVQARQLVMDGVESE